MNNVPNAVLTPTERAALTQRAIYREAGFTPFRLQAFEPYDLYAGCRDYLEPDGILTFTDTDGRLKALKPDVTLSIIRHALYAGADVTKLYYDENVYRAAPGEGFRELRQTGIECIGSLTEEETNAVPVLAAKSLAAVDPRGVLALGAPDLLAELIRRLKLTPSAEKQAAGLAASKNLHELASLCQAQNAEPAAMAALFDALSRTGKPAEVLPVLGGVCKDDTLSAAAQPLLQAVEALREAGYEDATAIDLSLTGGMRYYNGIVFQGFLPGAPQALLSGGRYDRLTAVLGTSAMAAGFAVYLDRLPDASGTKNGEADDWLNLALPKGRLGEKVVRMLRQAGLAGAALAEDDRRLTLELPESKLRIFWVKPVDVPAYIQRGAADLGVAGKDVLAESDADVFELADLGFGACRLAVAAKEGFQEPTDRALRVATKFPACAKRFYGAKGRRIDVIRLSGSIELAPVTGLADVIVDIVESGRTLKENGLTVIEDVLPVSARLAVNKAAYRFKKNRIEELLAKLLPKEETL